MEKGEGEWKGVRRRKIKRKGREGEMEKSGDREARVEQSKVYIATRIVGEGHGGARK